ncbi:MAG: hypothetical protein WCB51_03195 [Candidatus Dormiibacterota bacterium]
MAFCTIVEWDQDLGAALSRLQGQDSQPQGSLVRVFGATASGTYAIEVWESGEDARRFAESSAPALAQSALPPPDRVAGFETSNVFIRAEP